MVLLPTEAKEIQESMHATLVYGPYYDVLCELNAIVESAGIPVEGNLIYLHNSQRLDDQAVNPASYPKRRNFLAACRQSKHLLEVGFGGGHSALLALSAGLEYHGIDNCAYRYSRPAADFLKSRFPDRFFFYQGDAETVLADFWQKNNLPAFDLIHYDSSRGANDCQSFFDHVLGHCAPKAWCIFDDCELQTIRSVYNQFIESGKMKIDMPFGWEPYERQAIARKA